MDFFETWFSWFFGLPPNGLSTHIEPDHSGDVRAWSVGRRAWSVERRASSVERGASSVERGASSVERRPPSPFMGFGGQGAVPPRFTTEVVDIFEGLSSFLIYFGYW